ncbi:MAG TPA: ATP-dependent DNA ligase [Rhizobiales bacterium]|nr:ATP-dependent DNA ligase [Hyphomicrobiales bacterium]
MRRLHDILKGKEALKLESETMPEWISPMLATLTHDLRPRNGWIYEHKFDGERCLAWRRAGRVTLYSRNRHELNSTYPEVVAVLEAPGPDFILDGEITAARGDLSDFQLLQKRMQLGDPQKAEQSGIAIFYNVFDLLHHDGYCLRALPQKARKEALEKLIDFPAPIHIARTIRDWSPAFQKKICAMGWEGLIAKDTTAPYVSKRARTWLKYKCAMGQAFVIAGYTDPKNSRTGFGALLLGVYDDAGNLHYCGKVGTGFDDELLAALSARMKPLEIDKPAFVDPPRQKKGIHWLKPVLVGEVGFSEWTSAGRLRHPRFKGLRDDKPATATRREDPQ